MMGTSTTYALSFNTFIDGTHFTQKARYSRRHNDYLSFKSFGRANWSYANGDRPVNYRSSSLEMVKKGVISCQSLLHTPMAERNNKKLKQKYYWGNQIWQIMVQSRRGLTPEQAANEIYMVYGIRTSVTKIIDCIIKDKEWYKETGGFHPNLSV